MAKPRHIVRKLHTTPRPSFDEQLWPIQVALVILGAFLAGICISVFHFDDPRIHLNAVTWLSALPIVIGLIMWSLRYAHHHLVRRAVFLSVVLSLIFNLALLVVMAWAKIFPAFQLDEQQTLVENTPRPVELIPEYVIRTIQEHEVPRRDMDKPVETTTPEVPVEQITRQDAVAEQTRRAPPLEAEQDPIDAPRHHVPPRQRVIESAPRHSKMDARLARQLNRSRPQLAQTSARRVPQPPSQAPPARMEAETTPVSRQAIELDPRQFAGATEPTAEQNAQAMRVARREPRQQPQTQASAAPLLPRRIEEPRPLPRIDSLTVALPSIARPSKSDALEPNNTRTEKQSTAGPLIVRQESELPEEPARQIDSRTVQRQQRAEPSPQLARTPQPVSRQRIPIQAAPPRERVAAATQAAASPAPSTRRPAVAAASTDFAPRPPQSPTVNPAELAAEEPALSPKFQVAKTNSRRATEAEVPTIRPQAEPTHAPARTRRSAPLATSAEAISDPASARATRDTQNPTAQPARTALAKAEGGVGRIGVGANLERGLPAPTSSFHVASASARRATSQQHLPQGPAISPSARARVSRSLAQQDQPQATLEAKPVELASAPGARRTAQMDANASAALTKAAANAPTGMITATKGDTDIDLGPTRIASNSAVGRAAGGGQPVLNVHTQAQMVARSATGGAPTVTIAAEQVADNAAAPRDTGGGQPPTLQAPPVAKSMTRTETGGELPVTAGPSSASHSGPPDFEGRLQRIAPRSIGRAEAIAAMDGQPEAGGGTKSRARAARDHPLVSNRLAELLSIAGAAESSGKADGQPIAAQGTQPSRAAAALTGDAIERPTGTEAAETMADAVGAVQWNRGIGRRSSSSSHDEGPLIAHAENEGASLSRSRRPAQPLAVGTKVPIEQSVSPPASLVADSASNRLDGGLEPGSIVRQQPGALPVNITAPLRPGAVGTGIAQSVGLPTRRAQAESEQVRPSKARFIRRQFGGPLRMNVAANLATDAFQRRSQRHANPEHGGLGQISPTTEKAIELGLVFLSRHQASDGSWSLADFGVGKAGYERESASMRSDTAATALAVLCYLGAGYHHKSFKYKEIVQSALDNLVQNQRPDGDLYVSQDPESSRAVALYSHGIASITLCEAYGMTQDLQLREPAQKALDFIVASQHADRGGWRYLPGRASDTSVTGWMMMALKSGELANLEIDREVYGKIGHWLDLAQASTNQRYLYRYNPFAPDTPQQRHGRRPSKAMTAVGLLMRLYMGWDREDQRMVAGAEYLLDNLPRMGTSRDNQRDTYYWYYATQVMFHMGGKYWDAWNDQCHPLLVDTQVAHGVMAGSWNPRLPVPDRWGPHGGRIYVTTMNLLSLEIYYRHLPIYEETAR